jgi:nucleoside-triphosphatase
MIKSAPNILITGTPGIGKTTLIREIADRLVDQKPDGFYTAEIREIGRRVGFALEDFQGHRFVLAHIGHRGGPRVGKYHVDLEAFEQFLVSFSPEGKGRSPILIDEIGKMECYSEKFVTIVRKLLDSNRPVVASIALKGSGFIEEVKSRRDVDLIMIDEANRGKVAHLVLHKLMIDNRFC